ncbi:MAG: hypothetical protein GC181_04995 [Bacteroidetes bacterium]|nr:hypothetical protein [Bacteroidota bacterium]
MKNLALFTMLFAAFTFQACKDDEPVTTTTTTTDIRDDAVGEYNTHLTIYNAKTLALKKEYDLFLVVQKSSKDTKSVNFYIDGLSLFMTGSNFRQITGATAFDIPEQEVKDYGNLKGSNYINVTGETGRFQGVCYPSDKKITVYCEKDNGGTSDNDLYEFKMTKK